MDGDIDYTRYSPRQLVEALNNIARERYPHNYANLLAELQKRGISSASAQGPPGTVSNDVFAVRFSKGSLAAADNVQELYGRGELQLGADGVEIRGRARRLFRSGRDVTLRIPLTDIVNVAHERNRVQFDVVSPRETPRRFVFWTTDAAAAEQIAARLPTAQTETFRTALAESREFLSRLLSVSPTARVTPFLIGANLLVFVAMAFAGAGVLSPDPEVHVRWGSNFGPRTTGGEWWRLGTSMFVHFGGIHLLLNMWVLYAYGALAERLYGSAHFLVLYVLAGLTGSLASVGWNPAVNSAGASGAIFGVFGGLLAFVVQGKNRMPASIMVEHRNSMLLFLGYNLFFGFIHPGIDNAAHLGGLVGGFLLGLALARPVDAEYRAEHGSTRLVTVAIAGAALLVLAAQLLAPR